MKTKLAFIFLLLKVPAFTQAPPLFIHQDVFGKVSLTESRSWFTHLNSFEILKDYNKCKEVTVFTKNSKYLEKCVTNFNPSNSLQYNDQTQTNLIHQYEYTRIYNIKKPLKDSLIFEISGESNYPDFGGVVYRSLEETRKYNSDSLLSEITLSVKRFREKLPPLKWQYIYEEDKLKYVLLQEFDSIENYFYTYHTLEWIYEPKSDICKAYLEYSGPPIPSIKDSIEFWANKLSELSQMNLLEQDFGDPNFFFGKQKIHQFYYFHNEQNHIISSIGYEHDFYSIFESEIQYNKAGDIRNYHLTDYSNFNKLTFKSCYTYNKSGKIIKKHEKTIEEIGTSKYHEKLKLKFTYTEQGMISSLKGKNIALYFSYD